MIETKIRTGSRTSRNANPRRWWRALDELTLETMNPPIPTHVRAAMSDRNGIRPDPTAPDANGSPARAR